MDDINLLKGRMAEALVEGIFKRAQYMVARVARETQVSALMRTGQSVPDFVVWKALDENALIARHFAGFITIGTLNCPPDMYDIFGALFTT